MCYNARELTVLQCYPTDQMHTGEDLKKVKKKKRNTPKLSANDRIQRFFFWFNHFYLTNKKNEEKEKKGKKYIHATNKFKVIFVCSNFSKRESFL